MRLFKNDNRGFTLIEMVVSLTIVALIAGAMMANYRDGERTNKLMISANKLAANIRMAQNNTLGAVKYGTSTPEGGWGVHIDTTNSETSYKLFANENYNSGSNLIYDPGEALIEYGGKTVTVEEGVRIATTTAGNEVDVTFFPPDPDTIIYDGSNELDEVEIVLENQTGATQRVRVNSFGLIEILK